MPRDALAFDRASVRAYDRDGRLHVELTPISKANVCPYYGREIPDYEALGLEPDRLYRLYRDPEELEKAAASFNNLPLLSKHVPVTADSHQPEIVVGSTGTDAEFSAPYLKNSLVIWARDAIKGVETETQKELSSAYRYRADMTPGAIDGETYDGVMRDILGNHVALVEEGRAGPDVVVGDSNEEIKMAKTVLTRKGAMLQGAALAFLKPKLAQDAKIDIAPAFAGVDHKNFNDKKPAIVADITKRVAGKLAQDADLGDLAQVLDTFDGIDPIETEEPKATDAEGGDGLAELKAQVAALSEAVAKLVKGEGAEAGAMDEEDAPKKDDEDKVTKPAMDKAIEKAVKVATDAATKRQVQIREAERAVRPYVGDLTVALDSAEAIYETALKTLNVNVEGVHPSAFPAILSTIPVPGSSPKPKANIAQDAAAAKSFSDRNPDAARIRTI